MRWSTAGGQVPVLIIESANPSPDASLYLSRALEVAAAPGFATRVTRTDRVTPEDIAAAAVIVLNDARPPSGPAGRALASAVNAGAGLLVLLGERSAWTGRGPGPAARPAGRHRRPVGHERRHAGLCRLQPSRRSRSSVRPAAAISPPRASSATARSRRPPKAVARFDDGGVAVAERKVGRGTVLAWASTFDSYWNDFRSSRCSCRSCTRPCTISGATSSRGRGTRSATPTTPRTRRRPEPPDGPPPAARSPCSRPRAGPSSPFPARARRTVPLTERGFYEIRPAASAAEADRRRRQRRRRRVGSVARSIRPNSWPASARRPRRRARRAGTRSPSKKANAASRSGGIFWSQGSCYSSSRPRSPAGCRGLRDVSPRRTAAHHPGGPLALALEGRAAQRHGAGRSRRPRAARRRVRPRAVPLQPGLHRRRSAS